MTTSNQNQFKNDNLSVTVTKEPGCRVHLDVVLTPEAVKAARHQALKVINKEASIPGFRKGRAPDQVIEQRFSTHIEREWREIVLQTSFNDALNLIKTHPFSNESIQSASIKSISLENGATLSYDFEERPRIPSVPKDEFSKLKIPAAPRHDVTEKEIAGVIEELLLREAEWTEITDRPVKEGDYVDLDIDVISEPARNVCTEARFGVSPGKMEDWMRKLIIGAKPGQVIEGMSEKDHKHDDCHDCNDPTHHHEHDKDFVPALCRFTVHGIKQAKAPELTDEVAKKYGANDVEDLKQKVTLNLNRKADQEQKNLRRMSMEKALLEKYHVEIPHSFLNSQAKNQRKHIIDTLRAEGMEESSILEEAKKIEEGMMKKAEQDFQLHFLLQSIANENQIKVGEDEVMMEFMQQMWMNQAQNQPQSQENPEDAQARIHMKLLLLKTLDFLVDHAK